MAFSSHRKMLERARSISSAAGEEQRGEHAPSGAADAHHTSAVPTFASKVVATLGEVSLLPAVLDELLAAGVSCFRLDAGNLRPPSWFVTAISLASEAVKRSGRLCAFMLDMRAGLETSLCRRETSPLSIVAGTEMQLTIARDESEFWSADAPHVLPLADGRLFDALQPGDTLHASRYLSAGGFDSALSLRVLAVDKEACTASLRAENGAVLDGYAQDAHIVVSRVVGQMEGASAVTPSLCEADVDVLEALVAAGHAESLDFLSLSFCESAAQVQEARKMLSEHGLGSVGILAKIETRLGVAAFEEILEACDGIIISRGNLGNSVRLEACVRLQKEIIVRTNLAAKPVMLTRVLDSMCSATRPTRAEATDVANAVLDGVDGFVLGAETVRGLYPIEVVQCVQSIAVEAEKVFNHRRFFTTRFEALVKEGTPLGLRASMASSLVRVADKVSAKLIVVFTKTGRQPREVSMWRPETQILSIFQPTLTCDDGIRWRIRGRAEARRALLLRSVIPILADPRAGLNEEAMLTVALQFAESSLLVGMGDNVVLGHRLREDDSISIISLGDPTITASSPPFMDKTASTAHLSALERTPSAADMARQTRRQSVNLDKQQDAAA